MFLSQIQKDEDTKKREIHLEASWRLMEAIFFNTRKALAFDQWQLRAISKLNQIPAIFVISPSFSTSFSHFWFPGESYQEQTRRAQPAAGVTQLHPVGLGAPDLNCEIGLKKLQARGKAQNSEIVNLHPERREKPWWRARRAHYNLKLSIDSCHTHFWLHLTEQHHFKTLRLCGFLVHNVWNLALTSINFRGATQIVPAEIWASIAH